MVSQLESMAIGAEVELLAVACVEAQESVRNPLETPPKKLPESGARWAAHN
jgi:hypothetical protein